MKLTSKQLRSIINEELLRGVPDFVLRDETTKFTDGLKRHMLRYVNIAPGDSTPVERSEALKAIDVTLSDLAEEIHELLQDRIYDFLEKI